MPAYVFAAVVRPGVRGRATLLLLPRGTWTAPFRHISLTCDGESLQATMVRGDKVVNDRSAVWRRYFGAASGDRWQNDLSLSLGHNAVRCGAVQRGEKRYNAMQCNTVGHGTMRCGGMYCGGGGARPSCSAYIKHAVRPAAARLVGVATQTWGCFVLTQRSKSQNYVYSGSFFCFVFL